MEPDLDLLVIGGGMAGLTAAVDAARNGRSVIVIEIGADVRHGLKGFVPRPPLTTE